MQQIERVGAVVDEIDALAVGPNHEAEQRARARIQRRRGSIGLIRRRPGSAGFDALIALFLESKPTEGRLLVGCWIEAVGLDSSKLPGIPAPTAGFMNTNRYLSSPEEVRELIRLFARPSRPAEHRPEGA